MKNELLLSPFLKWIGYNIPMLNIHLQPYGYEYSKDPPPHPMFEKKTWLDSIYSVVFIFEKNILEWTIQGGAKLENLPTPVRYNRLYPSVDSLFSILRKSLLPCVAESLFSLLWRLGIKVSLLWKSRQGQRVFMNSDTQLEKEGALAASSYTTLEISQLSPRHVYSEGRKSNCVLWDLFPGMSVIQDCSPKTMDKTAPIH